MSMRLLVVLLVLANSSCGQKVKDGTSGSAKVIMSKSTSLNVSDLNLGATLYTPSKFSVKFLSIYLVNDVGSDQGNIGIANYIWANPDCTLTDSETEEDKKKYTYKTMDGSCTDDKVNTSLELARSADLVNADLNSQNLSVLPGTYNYVRMTLCIGSTQSNNVTFKADGMTDSVAVKGGGCGITSAKATSPIVIGEGESVNVSLAYDLTGIVYDYGEGMGKGDNCYFNADSTVRRCAGMPPMVPTANKN